MLFSSPIFLFLFLPIVLLLYFISPKKIKNIVLFIVSLIFYSWGEGSFVFTILALVLINYFLALQFSKKNKFSKTFFILAIILDLLFLVYFKYANFLVAQFIKVVSFAHISLTIDPKIQMPLGISFIIFHLLSYIFDVQKRKIRAERNPFNLALYIFLFPHLIAGPIVRYADIGKQIISRHTPLAQISQGFDRFIIGLGKKVIIANNLAVVSDRIFSLFPHQLSQELLWLGLICFALQIYFDFSGYSDMAIGLAKMFGFNFNENFNYPYLATSIQDFWRRWHITLSTWFRDYLYIPLGGNRKGALRTTFNLLFVFFLTGFWHGANWNFIIWGLYFGIFLVFERVIIGEKFDTIYKPLRHVYALLVILIGWLFFKIENISYAFYLLKILFGFVSPTTVYNFDTFLTNENKIILIGALILAFPILPTLWDKIKKQQSLPIYKVASAFSVFILALILTYSAMQLASDTYNPFIYFRF